MTGRLIAAARSLTAVAVKISAETIALMEANGSAWLHSDDGAEAVRSAFENLESLLPMRMMVWVLASD